MCATAFQVGRLAGTVMLKMNMAVHTALVRQVWSYLSPATIIMGWSINAQAFGTGLGLSLDSRFAVRLNDGKLIRCQQAGHACVYCGSTCATAQGEGSGGQDETLRRLRVSQAGWKKRASAGQHTVGYEGRSRVVTAQEDGLEQQVW